MRSLLTRLRDHNVHLRLVDGELSVKFSAEKMDSQIIDEIKQRKQELIEYLKSIDQNDYEAIPILLPQPSYPLSSSQRRLWILSQFEGAAEAYNLQVRLWLKDEYDEACLRKTLKAVLSRHEILRTVFERDATGDVRQRILEESELVYDLNTKDLRTTKNKEEAVDNAMEQCRKKSFDLEHGPLWELVVLRVDDNTYVFCCTIHHIISDGWSVDILSRDVLTYYQAYRQGATPDISDLRIQYKDYAAWQLNQMNDESYHVHRNFWLHKLSGQLPALDLPGQKPRPKNRTHNGHTLGTYIHPSVANQLQSYCQKQGGSLFMGLLASWMVLFYRYTSQRDIIIGTPVAGRDHIELENQIGCYVNTLVLRNQLSGDDDFNTLFNRIKESTLMSYEHQAYPFDQIIENLNLRSNTSRNDVFDIMIVLQNSEGESMRLEFDPSKSSQIETIDFGASKFDMTITFQEGKEGLSFQVNYNTDLYESSMITMMIGHYKEMVAAVLKTPEEKIGTINYLTDEERYELISMSRGESIKYQNESVLDLFCDSVRNRPEAIAMISEEVKYTYKELDEVSNQFAHFLDQNGKIHSDTLVGIKLARTHWLIVSILGTLKSGRAYVPIDPSYPENRTNYIERDSQCVVMDEGELAGFIEFQDSFSTEYRKADVQADNLAYVIYTSGSTGVPKGVMIEHGNFYTFIKWCHQEFSKSHIDKVLFVTSVCFDLSIFEIFFPLTTGRILDIVKDPLSIPEHLDLNHKTLLNTVPSIVGVLLSQDVQWEAVEVLNMAGEPIPQKYVGKILGKVAEIRNLYGPSEDTTYSTVCRIDSESRISIGRPITNTQLYILDEFHRIQPKGVIGEICLSGTGLARGYLNQLELTAEKFIAHPLEKGKRLYRTGDMGRWLADGSVEFMGRKDDQVKVRGHRIELGEVEYTLLTHEGIENAVVLLNESEVEEAKLIAYFVSGMKQNPLEVRLFLKEKLPDYMLPAYYIQLDKFPLTSNGKIDKRSLPSPDSSEINTGVAYEAPSNEVEEKLVALWEELLGVHRISIHDNFFDLGGHSLKAMLAITRMEKMFDTRLRIKEIFANPTIKVLSDTIRAQQWVGISKDLTKGKGTVVEI